MATKMFPSTMQCMIKCERIKIFDKNSASFLLLLLIINQNVFLHNIFLIARLEVFLYFHDQKHWNSFTGNVMSLKSSFLASSLATFGIIFALWSIGRKYLAKRHLKYSLSSIFWMLIKLFLGWFNSFGNCI